MEIKVLDGQTLVDIAVQELGDASRVMEIAELNEINITDDLEAGQIIQVPVYESSKRSIVNLFRDFCNRPACGITIQEAKNEGIDFWAIENDFVVQ